jgi:hypothetical protein
MPVSGRALIDTGILSEIPDPPAVAAIADPELGP